METVRDAKAVGTPVYISIGRPYSMFGFIDRHFPSLDSLRRIMSQVRTLKGCTMVVEELEPSDEILEENEDIHTRYGISLLNQLLRD
ncbi:MAG: hypothetical protein JXR23_05140 [Pontiellaceae bacterium]|nr:hypothetical protein [Pontiellaceae bacterium]